MSFSPHIAPSSRKIQTEIAELLHQAGALDMYTIAHEINEAPFRVRAELRVMRRYRLVLEVITTEKHEWELTHAGHTLAAAGSQLELGR